MYVSGGHFDLWQVQRLCEDSVAEAMLSGFVKPGEALEVDAADAAGAVLLRNARGKRRVHEAAEAQGIEDDTGWDADSAMGLAPNQARQPGPEA